MSLLQTERKILESVMPGLDAHLASVSLQQLESTESPVLQWFKDAGGTGLLIPRHFGGLQHNALDVLRIQRALGSRSPSLALASNMHNCTVAAIPTCGATEKLLSMIASERLLVASGFAEGHSGVSIQSPAIAVNVEADGLLLSGSKKPCSLALSMDIFTASVLVPQPDGSRRFALVTVPADVKGLSRRPFGQPGLLEAAENLEVVLDKVHVSHEYVSYFGEELTLNRALSNAFLWFEIFVSASYLGAATALLERLYKYQRGCTSSRARMATALQVCMLSLEAVANRIDAGICDEDTVVSALMARFGAQQTIMQISSEAAELLGGVRYMSEFDVTYLLKVTRALAFHPPSRCIMDRPIDSYMHGDALSIP